MRATVAAPGRRRGAIQFSEPPHNTSLRVQAKKPPVLGGVARMSEAISGKDCPAYRCAHAGYGRRAGTTQTHRSIFRAAAHHVIAGASEEAPRVEWCSPDERSDIRERRPRILLRSCGLRSPRR